MTDETTLAEDAAAPAEPAPHEFFRMPAPGTPDTSEPLPGAPRSERLAFLLALGTGIAIDVLAMRHAPGIGLTIGLLAGLVAIVALDRRHGLRLASRNRWPYLVAAALLALAFSFRTTPSLLALDAIALFMTMILLAVRIPGRRLRDALPLELALGLIEVTVFNGVRAIGVFVRRFRPRPEEADADSSERSFRERHARDIAVGVLVAIPVLAVFATLLAASDEGFARLARDLVDWDISSLVQHVVGIAFAGFVTLAAIVAALAGQPTSRIEERRGAWAGPATVWIVLGSTALLFATFLALQGSYLFGGADYLEEQTGLTAAEYAVRGFYELLVVSGLTVALLLGARMSFRPDTGAAAAYRVLAPVLAALAVVLVGSAMARLFIYADRFGLTEQRIYAAATLLWIAIVLAWLGTRVALDRALQLGAWAGSTAVGVVILLNLVNPQGLAARTNLERQGDGSDRGVDVPYLLSLGSDATPAIVEHIDEVPPARRHEVLDRIEARLDRREDDWRSSNASHAAAQRAVDDARED